MQSQDRPPLPPDDPSVVLLGLPDDAFTPLDDALAGHILADVARYGAATVRLLDVLQGDGTPPRSGYRSRHLACLIGTWRLALGAHAICGTLDTDWGFGGAEAVHALTRIGAPAIDPLLFVMFDGARGARARRRAALALASVGTAATDFALDPEWAWDGAAARGACVAALRVVLERAHEEPAAVVAAAAEGLCHLRAREAWEEIASLFGSGALRETDALTVRRARELITGQTVDFQIGAFRAPLLRAYGSRAGAA